MFRRGMQRGPDPKAKQNATLNAFAAARPEGFVTHIELYLSRVRPFWRNEELNIRPRRRRHGPAHQRCRHVSDGDHLSMARDEGTGSVW